MSAVTAASEATFDAEVLQSPLPVVVDFGAAWCGPCKVIAPVMDQLAEQFAGRMRVVTIDVDANPGLATKFGVMSVPTLMIFRDGEMIARQIGAAPKAKLEQWMGQAVRSPAAARP